MRRSDKGWRIAAAFVAFLAGSYSNVVGLPLEAFYGILKGHEYHF